MADETIQIRQFTVKVQLPVENKFILFANMDIDYQEMRFGEARDRCRDKDGKIQLDRCRALLKWAGACNARLIDILRYQKEIDFTFVFDTFENLYDFQADLVENVEGAIMT